MTESIDQYLQLVKGLIEQHGWIVQGVAEPDRPWAYTVGLTLHDRRELIVVGFPGPLAADFLNTAARRHKIVDFFPDTPIEIPGFPVRLKIREIDVTQLFVHKALFRSHPNYQRTALQLLWPTDSGLYPGDPGYNCMSQDIPTH
jgi:hypothetical protein